MKKPYFEIDQKTNNIIMELQKKCIDLDLGNISFQHYATYEKAEEIEFCLTEYKDYWELTVVQRWAKTTDVYRFEEDNIIYKFSEKY